MLESTGSFSLGLILAKKSLMQDLAALTATGSFGQVLIMLLIKSQFADSLEVSLISASMRATAYSKWSATHVAIA